MDFYYYLVQLQFFPCFRLMNPFLPELCLPLTSVISFQGAFILPEPLLWWQWLTQAWASHPRWASEHHFLGFCFNVEQERVVNSEFYSSEGQAWTLNGHVPCYIQVASLQEIMVWTLRKKETEGQTACFLPVAAGSPWSPDAPLPFLKVIEALLYIPFRTHEYEFSFSYCQSKRFSTIISWCFLLIF